MTNLVLKRIDDLALRDRCSCPLNKIVVKPNQFSRACSSIVEYCIDIAGVVGA